MFNRIKKEADKIRAERERKDKETEPPVLIFESFKPKIIDDDSTNFSSSLGISDERKEVIDRNIEIYLSEKYSKISSKIVELCEKVASHPNEVAYISYRVGRIFERLDNGK